MMGKKAFRSHGNLSHGGQRFATFERRIHEIGQSSSENGTEIPNGDRPSGIVINLDPVFNQ